MTKTFSLEFLSEQTLVTEQLEYSSDEDGNISIHQENMYVTLIILFIICIGIAFSI